MSNVPVYYMSLFRMSRKVSLGLKKCQQDFLWDESKEKKDHLVKWEDVCRLKEYGGLGIGHLRERNLALLGKWLWCFFNENNSLWQSIIRKKYGMDPNGWDSSRCVSPSMSLLWRQIILLYPLFISHVRLIVGDGFRINF